MNSFFVSRLARRCVGVVATLSLIFIAGSAWAAGATYYSQGSLAPEAPASWNTVRAGGGTDPTDFTGGDVFVIQSSHNMGTAAAWTVSGAGATMQIASGGTLTANDLVAVPAFQIDDGGTYVHNATSGADNGAASDLPGSTSQSFGATSTVEFQKWANGGTSPVALPAVTWGNLKINVATLAGSWQQSGGLSSIAGNLIIQSTGGTTREFGLNADSPATSTLNLIGDLQVSGGIFNITSGTAVETFDIGGSINLSGTGTITATGAGPHAVSFTGGAASASFTQSGGTLTATNLNWTVASGKTLTLSSPFAIPASRSFTVASGGTLAPAAALTVTGSLSVSGALRILPSGSVAGVVTYAGSGGLEYFNSATITVGNEWTGAGSVGAGVPASVSMNGAGTVDFPSGTRGTPGNLTQTAGTINLDAVTLEVGGSMAVTPGFDWGTSTVRFNTGSAATLSCTAGGVRFNALTVDKGAGSLAMAADIRADGPTQILTGTISTGAHSLIANGLAVSAGATLQTTTFGSVSTNGGFQCDGSFVGGALGSFLRIDGPGTWSSSSPTQNFGEVTIGSGTVTLASSVTVSEMFLTLGSLNLSGKTLTCGRDITVNSTGTLTVPSGSALSVGRNLSVTGIYTPGGSLRSPAPDSGPTCRARRTSAMSRSLPA